MYLYSLTVSYEFKITIYYECTVNAQLPSLTLPFMPVKAHPTLGQYSLTR